MERISVKRLNTTRAGNATSRPTEPADRDLLILEASEECARPRCFRAGFGQFVFRSWSSRPNPLGPPHGSATLDVDSCPRPHRGFCLRRKKASRLSDCSCFWPDLSSCSDLRPHILCLFAFRGDSGPSAATPHHISFSSPSAPKWPVEQFILELMEPDASSPTRKGGREKQCNVT
ncbi:hypothetical protein BIW11_02718 [Tropilaelaps mercedesae]|uniref:Uncharacterized protein n=1 Tax=Tropilaelaps mercedesae TaxID=418985 RepID=A0A1V9XYI5_9ACAR|nr:hypothetical protein BIW11_02718 [Tropilaelaps mercedesae]